MRLIDADALLEKMKKTDRYFFVKFDVEEMPTIKAEPVRHGKWIDNGERDILGVPTPFAISCSECGSSAGAKWNKYCPNCGAKMEGE